MNPVRSSLLTLITLSSAFPFQLDGTEIAEVASPTKVTRNRAPDWVKKGAYVYRLATPDDPNTPALAKEGFKITSNLLDRTVEQIPITMGLVGDDHPGRFNWDGLWPYWNRVTFRVGSWENLSRFMAEALQEANTKVSFHVNLTDVNIGLIQYPETRAFFEKLVDTQSIYRRDFNPETKKRDIEPPYVPQSLEQFLEKDETPEKLDSIRIIALVNYKNFWDSGLAKEMIDGFFERLPYAPPVLYLDVLTLEGANFTTGYPDGPLGGSQATQLEGALNIAAYLRSKGSEVGTEGDRPFLNEYGTYGWLHCLPGLSTDDYQKILGAPKAGRAVLQHVFGNTGGFAVSPISVTESQLKKIRNHYALLLAGKESPRKMPGLSTWHLSDRKKNDDEFNLLPGPNGSGDPFRGDWIDLVNHFYLTGIQELFHIGKKNYRTHTYNKVGTLHLKEFRLVSEEGTEIVLPILNFYPSGHPSHPRVLKYGSEMLEQGITAPVHIPKAGYYTLKAIAKNPGRGVSGINVYLNKELKAQKLDIQFNSREFEEIEIANLLLNEGEQTLGFDPGPLYVRWSDGTVALWETPSLGKGFAVANGDVTYAVDYDRMWPDTWSGEKKIYFFSWEGTNREWKLPEDWASEQKGILYPLTPEGRGEGVEVSLKDRLFHRKLLPQVPYILTVKTH